MPHSSYGIPANSKAAPAVLDQGLVAVSSTAVLIADVTGLSAENIALADRAVITAITQPLRYTYDGTVPTIVNGHQLNITADKPTVIKGKISVGNLKFIRQTGTDGVVLITLERT